MHVILFKLPWIKFCKALRAHICYLDDILVSGANEAQHIQNLEVVPQRLQSRGIKVFWLNVYLCNKVLSTLNTDRIDETGLHLTSDKIKAIVDAPGPTTLSELESYLGLLNYNGRFMLNLSTMEQPLNQLLGKGQKWCWSPECAKAFQDSKHTLVNSPALVHYDATKPLQLACDASPCGGGNFVTI